MASWTLGASGIQHPVPSPLPAFLLVLMQGNGCTTSLPSLEPALADRPRFALFGLASKSETLAAIEEGDLLPASLPTQQLRPLVAGGGHQSLIFRSSPFSL